MKKFFASEYGIVPDKNKSYGADIADMLEHIGDDSEIFFDKGTYIFDFKDAFKRKYSISNTLSTEQQSISIILENRKNLILDFQGSELLFTGWQTPMAIDCCHNITIRNVSIDWKTPTLAEGIVLGVEENLITLQIDNTKFPHVVKNNVLYFTEEYWGESSYWAAMEYDQNTLRVRPNSADKVLDAEFKEVDENIVEMTGCFEMMPLEGNYLALRHGMRTQAGVFCQESKDICFENVSVHNTCGIAFVCQFSENIRMNSVAIIPNEQRGRFVTSSHDDALQFSNCKGYIELQNCRFRGMFDDAVNVHGTSTRIVDIKGNTVIGEFVEKCSNGFQRYMKKGDKISFLNCKNMNAYTCNEVDSFRLLNDERFEVIFLTKLTDDIRIGDAMENLTNTPAVHIQNCYFGSSRARGVLVATPGKTLICNNVFDTSGSAILASGDANGWFESGACNDVTISNNVFTEHCLSSVYEFGKGIISFYPVIHEPHNSIGFHRNICISNNHFIASDCRVLYALCVKNISFEDNQIVCFEREYKGTSCTQYEYCSDVKEKNNHVVGWFLN